MQHFDHVGLLSLCGRNLSSDYIYYNTYLHKMQINTKSPPEPQVWYEGIENSWRNLLGEVLFLQALIEPLPSLDRATMTVYCHIFYSINGAAQHFGATIGYPNDVAKLSVEFSYLIHAQLFLVFGKLNTEVDERLIRKCGIRVHLSRNISTQDHTFPLSVYLLDRGYPFESFYCSSHFSFSFLCVLRAWDPIEYIISLIYIKSKLKFAIFLIFS